MRFLNGAELRDFIKERQAKQVRALRQSWRVFPKLVIFYSSKSPVTETYMRLKEKYGEDILIEVERRKVDTELMKEEIRKANNDENIHGIIVQLPLENEIGEKLSKNETEAILSEISKEKDKGKIIILVIHNLRTAIKYCSRLILLSEGNIVKDGTVEEVITEENLNNVFGIKTKVYYNEISKFLDFYII